jgi:hypothetical protein
MKVNMKITKLNLNVMIAVVLTLSLGGSAVAQLAPSAMAKTAVLTGNENGLRTARPLVDLSARTTIYFTGAKKTIDLANDPHVEQGKDLDLKTNQAASHQGNLYTFNLGVLATREYGDLGTTLDAYAIMSGPGGIAGDDILFQPNVQVVNKVFAVNLAIGSNVLTFTIDPYQKTPESNENNNTFTVTINVERIAPPIRIPKKIDLTTQGKIYLFADQHAKKIDYGKDLLVQANATVTVHGSQALKCFPPPGGIGTCNYIVGIVGVKLNRVDQRAQTEFDASINGKKIYAIGFDMIEGVSTQEAKLELKLQPGHNQVLFRIDPTNVIVEEDETNNYFMVDFNVVP